ncbi:unnamed protein product [Cuscuta campestris]|uniref:Uncharacterized protein n=1 Tax=Cuscuta campestris TaxID=132261 RepID=A0A484KY59_9ASTE|nr:unnamed protein product [Cuscuta campestris]VFQ68459.1 unnamed protein product [Cuscuta campestris]
MGWEDEFSMFLNIWCEVCRSRLRNRVQIPWEGIFMPHDGSGRTHDAGIYCDCGSVGLYNGFRDKFHQHPIKINDEFTKICTMTAKGMYPTSQGCVHGFNAGWKALCPFGDGRGGGHTLQAAGGTIQFYAPAAEEYPCRYDTDQSKVKLFSHVTQLGEHKTMVTMESRCRAI